MAARAVYASSTLAIYVTRNDLALLLHGSTLVVPLVAGGDVLTEHGVEVRLTPWARGRLEMFYAAERAALANAPDKVGVPRTVEPQAATKGKKRAKSN